MYAFDPYGHAHLIPGMDVPTMNVLLDRVKGSKDHTINVHDVCDHDGRSRRVIVILLQGRVFDTFDFRR